MRKPEVIIYIVDDDASVRKGLEWLIRSVGYHVQTFASANDFLRHDIPDTLSCLVLDLRMPGMSGLDLQEKLQSAQINIPIIFLTAHGSVPTSVRAMKGGAVDFLEKPVDEQILLDAIHQAIEKDKLAKLQQAEIQNIMKRVNSLTPRELEIFDCVVTGMINKQIAYNLNISEKTVKIHRSRVMEKMGADSLAELVRLAEKARPSPKG